MAAGGGTAAFAVAGSVTDALADPCTGFLTGVAAFWSEAVMVARDGGDTGLDCAARELPDTGENVLGSLVCALTESVGATGAVPRRAGEESERPAWCNKPLV